MSDAEADAAFARAGVVCLPYRAIENSGVFAEAIRHGVVPVATAVGGLPETLARYDLPAPCPPDDPAALAGALAFALTTETARARASAGMARARRELTWGHAAEAHEALYETSWRADSRAYAPRVTDTDGPRASLAELEHAVPFSRRHIGPSPEDQLRMLALLGYGSLRELVDAAVPPGIRMASDLDLPPAQTEIDVLAELRAIGHRNRVMHSMIGLGYYATHTPQVVLRKVLENPAWYTAYTPYQPEISQGRLEALLNFQTMVADLSGLPSANASLLDEATAAAEAMTICRRVSKVEGGSFVIDADCMPQTIAVVRTRAEPLGLDVIVRDLADGLPDGPVFGVLLQYPGASGALRDHEGLIAEAHERGALAAVASDLLAAVAVPAARRDRGRRRRRHLAALRRAAGLRRAARRLHVRARRARAADPGPPRRRLGRRGRRARAAARAADARAAHPPREGDLEHLHRPGAARRDGLDVRRLPRPRGARGDRAARAPARRDPRRGPAPRRRRGRARRLLRHRAGARPPPRRRRDRGRASERHQPAPRRRGHRRHRLRRGHRATRRSRPSGPPSACAPSIDQLDEEVADAIPAGLRRTSDFLTHPVFHEHRSETQMLRYLRRLSGRDVALDRSMIPLGSCTMKLNATTEMQAITWPEFASLHPFAPLDQADGYLALIGDLERWLVSITGYDAVSLQPNSGAQGEYAGLLAIRGYHRSRGDDARDVCLIPASAHGTNAASAVMAGMRVVVVGTDEHGNVDMDDLRAKLAEHRARVAALMITYPSTHGVYETTVGEICDLVHEAGGQVYVDGANMNALVGLAQPGQVRRRRLAPEPAQDVLHPARRRRARASARSPCARTCARTCRTTRCSRPPAPTAGRARYRPRRGARPGSCRSRGPTSG